MLQKQMHDHPFFIMVAITERTVVANSNGYVLVQHLWPFLIRIFKVLLAASKSLLQPFSLPKMWMLCPGGRACVLLMDNTQGGI